ncbi:MAG: diguanylate cyclase [Magnetococcales bacterium]|nr:diguanylate cyclase [Magnetococcales bacterium]
MGKILIVDDDKEQILDPMVRQLARVFGGQNIEGVTDAEAAIQFSEREVVDVVVTDIMMPGMDGYDFCRQFRSNPLNLGYIIILSGRDGGIAEGLRAGADVYFRKPYQLEDLTAQIEKGLEVSRNRLNSVQDMLTGLFMRRIFDAVFTLESEKVKRVHTPLSVIMVDIDYFKKINDVYGHDVGDQVLREVARRLKQHSRKSDLFVRYGGEEFLLLLPGADAKKALEIAHRLHATMLEQPFPEVGSVTASFGVATETVYSGRLIVRVDKALYAAKAAGRNCIVFADTE